MEDFRCWLSHEQSRRIEMERLRSKRTMESKAFRKEIAFFRFGETVEMARVSGGGKYCAFQINYTTTDVLKRMEKRVIRVIF